MSTLLYLLIFFRLETSRIARFCLSCDANVKSTECNGKRAKIGKIPKFSVPKISVPKFSVPLQSVAVAIWRSIESREIVENC